MKKYVFYPTKISIDRVDPAIAMCYAESIDRAIELGDCNGLDMSDVTVKCVKITNENRYEKINTERFEKEY